MDKIENSAGRLHFVFVRLAQKSNMSLSEFCNSLGLAGSEWSEALFAYALLREEFEGLKIEIEGLKANKVKYDLYQKNLPDIEATLRSFRFNMQDNNLTFTIREPGMVALGFMASDFPLEGTDLGDLAALKKIVNELQTEILNTELPDYLRFWLLDLARIIRDGIDRYQIRGASGIERELSTILGELLNNQDLAAEAKSKRPSAFASILKAVDLMNNLILIGKKLEPAIAVTRKAIPYIKAILGYETEMLKLPAPSEADTIDT